MRKLYPGLSALVFAFSCLFTSRAEAGGFYIETGGGISQMMGGDGLFSSLTQTTSYGLGANIQFTQNFSHQFAPFQFHFGVKAKLSSSKANSTTYSMIGLYPHVRLEMARIYFGGGLTPLIWTREAAGFGFSNLSRPGGLAYTVEFGLLWRVVPFFHTAIEASAQSVSTSSGLSPFPEYTGSIQLRFLFPDTVGADERGNRPDRGFDGWRYPFGIAKPR